MSENTMPTGTLVSQHKFFEVTDCLKDGSLVIEFLTKSNDKHERINILPSRYEEFRELALRIAGRLVVVTGNGPIEGYFAIGYYATLFGATGVVFEDAGGKRGRIMPTTGVQPSDKQWLHVERQRAGVLVTIDRSSRPDGKWSDDEVGCQAPALLPVTSLPVTFTGSGGVHMYLLLGVSAACAGLEDVRIVKPVIPYAIRFTRDCAGDTVPVASEKKGVVVGIIGDPNSGKSVFSHAFNMALRELMPAWFESWIYDCDLASPTPDWYCTALVKAKPEVVKDYEAIRKSQKVDWNADMEKRCANNLGVLRTNLDLVIADLPGGRHPKDGEPYFEPKRVQDESRADMFRQCDAFIVLCRSQDVKTGEPTAEAIFEGWRTALAEYGLDDRIVARIDSSDPEADFSISSLVPDADGIFRGDIRGLDREHSAGETGQDMVGPVRKLVHVLAAIPVVNAARAATAKSFLTSDKGTRYGAAVRSASTGRIFAVGQYSSFNHSTNIHAEMNALAQAAAAGEPDVDILAIASTSPEKASPCGVCRQVILEHAARTGRDFDIALTTRGPIPVVVSASELLPRAWNPCRVGSSDDVRKYSDTDTVFSEPATPQVGSEYIAPPIHPGAPDCIALVWDDAFSPDAALVKFKYERTPDGRWLKLPHAFSESAAYIRYLTDKRRGDGTFTGLVKIALPFREKRNDESPILFKHPVPLSGDMLRFLSESLFGPAGIDASRSVRVTCSRMTGFATDDSDWDLCVAATPEQIDALRARVLVLATEGRIAFPGKSRSWKLIKDSFPGATADGGARIHSERRYAETFRLDGISVSFLYARPDSAGRDFAFPAPFDVVGRAAIVGHVVDASHAPYKRSESVVETVDHRRVRILCYYKTANLLKTGDSVSAFGVLCRHDGLVLGCQETLVLSAPAVDKLVWLS